MIENLEKLNIPLDENIDDEHCNYTNSHNISWLKNNYNDDIWELTPHIHTDDKSKYTVTWNIYDIEKNYGVFDRWEYWKKAAKELAYWMMESPETRCQTTSTLALSCRNIREFYEWLCFERRCFSLVDVKQEDINSFCEHISERCLAQSTVMFKFTVISYAYKLKNYLIESLPFNPFKTIQAHTLAKGYSIENGHTPTLYPKEIFSILNHALMLVKDSHQTLRLLKEYMKIHADNSIDHRLVYAKFYTLSGVKSGDLQHKVRALYGAAITIILILLAERKHELSLNKEIDVVELLNKDLDILVGQEKKTAGTVTGKQTERAVIQEVKDALAVILEITSYTKKKSDNIETILLKLPFGHSANGVGEKSYYLTTQALYVVLEHFAKSAKFNRVKLRPHMFRRAYSMLWTWRFEIGDLDDLSQMLKHNSTYFTEKYVHDEEAWKFMGDTERDLAFDILNRAFQGKILLSGEISETLERYSRLIQAKSKLLDAAAIADFVNEFIQINDMHIVAHSDGYCFIAKQGIEAALCRTDGIGLDPVKRKDVLCVKCPNFSIDNSRRAYWEKRISLHQEVVDSSNNQKLIETSKAFILDAKNMLSSIK